MITEIFRPIKNLISRFEILVNQRALEHADWKLKLKELSYKLKTSNIEWHTINKFYSLPNIKYNYVSGFQNLPDNLKITEIPSGIYQDKDGKSGGYGNFFVKNGIFYLTCGQKIYSFNPNTEEVNMYNNYGVSKYLWKIHWSDYPPKINSILEYWSLIGRDTDYTSIAPLKSGKYALLSWSGGTKCVVEGMGVRKRVFYILNSDFSLASQFNLGGEYADNLIDWTTIGNQIVLLTQRKITSQGGNIIENVFTFFNTSGFYQNEFIIRPAIYTYVYRYLYGRYYSGILKYIESKFYIGIDYLGTYEEYIASKPPDIEIIGHGFDSTGEWVYVRELYCVNPTLGYEEYYQPITYGWMTSNQENIFLYDNKNFQIRVFNTQGVLQRIISLRDFEYFRDEGLTAGLNSYSSSYIQIAIDSEDTRYLYIYLPAIPKTIGRCKIDN